MSANDDYLLGSDVLGAFVPSRAATVVAPAPTRAARQAAVTAPAPTVATRTAQMAAVPTTTSSFRTAQMAAVPTTAPSFRTADRAVSRERERDRAFRAADIMAKRALGIAAAKAAGKPAKTPASKSHIMQAIDASNRLAAVGNKLAGKKAKKGRKSVAKLGARLARLGQRMSKKATTIVVGIGERLLQSAVVGAVKNFQLQAAATVDPEKLAAFQRRVAVIAAVATAGENASKIDDLSAKLGDANAVLVRDGAAIITRVEDLVTSFESVPDGVWYPNAPVEDWMSTAESISADAGAWLSQANAALGTTATIAPEGAAGGASGGGGGGADAGGGGGGGGEDPFAEEGGGEEGGGGEGEEGLEEPEGGPQEIPEEEYEGGEREQGYEQPVEYATEDYSQAVDEYQPASDEYAMSETEEPAEASSEEQAEETAEEVSGAALPFTLKSELPNVSDEKWTRFAVAMRTAHVGAVSPSNELGMFAMKPRRLVDLDLAINLECMRAANGRQIWICDFVPPLTAKMFLTDPSLQYRTFVKSMKNYVDGLRSGSIPKPEGETASGTTLSGILAVLHRAGPKGLKKWNDPDSRFEETQALFEKVNGIF